MQLPTGGGKTVIAGAFAKMLEEKAATRKCVVLYLVHRVELADQAETTLREVGLGRSIGRIQSGYPTTLWKPFQIASIQTLANRLEATQSWLKPLVVIVDEAHHCRAQTWEKVIAHFDQSYILGMTATPQRLDGKGLNSLFNHLVCGPTTSQLMAKGYLSEMRMFVPPPQVDLKSIKKSAHEYQKRALDDATTDSVVVSSIETWERIASQMKTIHYAVSVRHSLDFVAKLRERGYTADHVDGGTDSRKRDETMRNFRNGNVQVISNYNIITEGFDAPACECVLLGRATMSLTLYLQMIGRGMRPKPGGGAGTIIDPWGNILQHGTPTDDREWTLEGGFVKDEKDGKKRRPSFRRCSECDMIYKAALKACPFCGHEAGGANMVEVDVDLVQFGDEVKPKPKKQSAKATRRELNKRIVATHGDPQRLIALASEYGYQPTVVHQWRRIFGPIWSRSNQHGYRFPVRPMR